MLGCSGLACHTRELRNGLAKPVCVYNTEKQNKCGPSIHSQRSERGSDVFIVLSFLWIQTFKIKKISTKKAEERLSVV